MKNLELGIPAEPDEPKPWTVEIHRHHVARREPFLTREDAIQYAYHMADNDCWLEGVFRPDGTLDKEATEVAAPWRFR